MMEGRRQRCCSSQLTALGGDTREVQTVFVPGSYHHQEVAAFCSPWVPLLPGWSWSLQSVHPQMWHSEPCSLCPGCPRYAPAMQALPTGDHKPYWASRWWGAIGPCGPVGEDPELQASEPMPGPVIFPALRQLLPTQCWPIWWCWASCCQPAPGSATPYWLQDAFDICLWRAGVGGWEGICKRLRNSPLQQVLRLWCCFAPYPLTSWEDTARMPQRQNSHNLSLLFWVSWHWGRHLGYSFCPWHQTSTAARCITPAWPAFNLTVWPKNLDSPLHLRDWDEYLAPTSFSPFAAIGSCWHAGISHLFLGSTVWTGPVGPIPASSHRGECQDTCWIFRDWPLGQ